MPAKLKSGDSTLSTTTIARPTKAPAKALVNLKRTNTTGRYFVWLQVIAFLFGLGLLIYVIQFVGVGSITDALGRVGTAFLLILLISGTRHLARSIAMRTAFARDQRQFNLGQVFATRLGGEAVSFLTFTGPLLGELTKAALLKNRVPLTKSVSALIIDNLIYNMSVAIFLISGTFILLGLYPLPTILSYALIVIAVLTSCGLVLITAAARQRIKLLTRLVTFVVTFAARLGLKRRMLVRRRRQISRLESDIYDFYHHRPGDFFLMFALNFAAHATSVIEIYSIIYLLGARQSISTSYIIESMTKVVNITISFVPASIGLYVGGTELVLQTLGFATAIGVALAIIRKASTVFWTVVGLLILVWRTAPNIAHRIAHRHPGVVKRMDNLVLANFFHRPVRSLTSIFGIGIGVLLIILTVGLAHGVLSENARREANIGAEIIIRPSGTIGLGGGSQPLSLPLSRALEISEIEGVRTAVPMAQNFVSSGSGFGSRLLDGIEFDTYSRLSGLRIIEGTSFNKEDEAIIDVVWQKENKTPIGSTIEIYDRPFKIVGVYEPPAGGRIKIPLKTMQKQLGDDSLQFCNRILVSCVDPKRQDEVAARITERFPDNQILFTRDLPELYAAGVPALNIFLAVIIGIAASISMLVILLSMYTSVMERTRQIGILKSLGMSKPLIVWVVQQEALVISMLGVIFGVGLAYLARGAIMHNTTLTVVIEPLWIVASLAIGIVGGSIGALYPALKAARQDAVKALSYD